MCPGPHSTRLFGDDRDHCATRATALASIDAAGRVTRFVDDIDCGLPDFRVVSDDTTSVIGHGNRRCDTDTVGATLYVFPHCSLVMNYPGNEDYAPGQPVGLLVQPYDC
jgi:hypothetical protein